MEGRPSVAGVGRAQGEEIQAKSCYRSRRDASDNSWDDTSGGHCLLYTVRQDFIAEGPRLTKGKVSMPTVKQSEPRQS